MTKKVADMTLQEQAEAILKQATEKGVNTNFYFVTTFKRYQVQMRILSELEKEISASGTTVTKGYGSRENLYTNPAILEYNRTASAANNTVKTLLHIVKESRPDDPGAISKLDAFKLDLDLEDI